MGKRSSTRVTARREEADGPAPTPRRMSRPRWLDPRVIGGLLLVVAAVVIGARVVGSGNTASAVWAASRSLAAGTVLVADDLQPVEVNLGEAAAGYLAAGEPPVGRVLNRAIDVDELLPASAVVDQAAGRVLVIPVAPGRMPPGVGHGSRVDLYLTADATGPGEPPRTSPVATDLIVQSVSAPSSGGLSGASASEYHLAVHLDPTDADRLVRLLPTGDITVVLQAGGSR